MEFIIYLPANRPNDILLKMGLDFTGSDHALMPIFVKTTVGLTLLVRMPYGPSSMLITRVT